MTKTEKKFIKKNREVIKELNDFIDNNKDDISTLIVSIEMFLYLLVVIGDLDVDSEKYESALNMKVGRYRGVKIIYNEYMPVKNVKYSLKSEGFEFNIPCICGIFSDEPHGELK
jgi:frataxin-like iron-binding protein CyaY